MAEPAWGLLEHRAAGRDGVCQAPGTAWAAALL